MANQKKKLNLRKCVAQAKRDGSLYDSIDLTQASMDVMKEYNITEKKRQQLVEFLKQGIAKTKLTEYKKPVEPEYPKIKRKNVAHEELRKEADKLPTTEMTKYMRRDVIKAINSRKLENAWPNVMKDVMTEVLDEYFEVTHQVGVDSRIKPVDGSDSHIHLAPYKYLGKTSHYLTYVWLRKELQAKLFTPYPLMRRLLFRCVQDLPDLLVDFSEYRGSASEINNFAEVIRERLEHERHVIIRFHEKLMAIAQTQQYHKDIPKGKNLEYWSTATGLVDSHVTRLIRDTIFHIVDVTGNKDRIPYLKLYLKYDRALILYPSAKETYHMYEQFIEQISNLTTDLLSFESTFIEGHPEKFISTYIPGITLKLCKRQVRTNIKAMYEHIDAYVKKIEFKYREIFASENESDMTTSSDVTFEEGYNKIDFYLSFVSQVQDMISDEYYAIGELEQEDCKANLKQAIYDQIDDIASKLVLQHVWENEDICETFNMLVMRASKEPETSEELMELGVFMTWANAELMQELTERIQHSLVVLARLIEITTITEDHMDLNSTTVNWLKNIKPVLEANSSMFEQLKFDFEERLQRAIEKLNIKIRDVFPYLVTLDNMNDSERAREYIHHLSHMLVTIRECENQKEWINNEERTFKFPLSQFKQLEELKNYIYPFFRLVKVCLNWKRARDVWLYGRFEFLDPTVAELKVEDMYKELIKTQKMYRNKLRQLAAENHPRRFMGSVDDPDILNVPAPIKLTTKVLRQIKEFRPNLTLMGIMCNKALLQRHWNEMSEIAGYDITPNAGTTLQKLVDKGMDENMEAFDIISSGAVKELMLITSLLKMQGEWQDIKFKTSAYKDTGIYILTSLDDVQAVLDDHIIKTLSMRGSIFVKAYESEVVAWYEKITRINNTIEEWGKVQAQWLYLLPIFSSKDIVNQMPAEGILFKDVDAVYRRYMTTVQKDPRVIETAGAAGLLEAMHSCLDMLDQINDGVTAYLEKKRLFFPRFFFLSNDEMLEILSETKDPLRVQPHLRKCFEAINKLHFDNKLQIHSMFSQENENISFLRIISTEEAGGSVEKWLIQVEDQMIKAVREQIFVSWQDYKETPRTKWVLAWPGQVVLCVSQIFWTAEVTSHLNAIADEGSEEIENYFDKLLSNLKDIVDLVRDPNLTYLNSITIKALIVIDVHAKDVTEDLVEKNVQNTKEFKWLAQLRYYWEDEECLIRVTNATVAYAYEYLGNSDRLVITPLTDRCYRTLVGAYHLHLNGAPEGPAGTGKTETTKDLAKAIAIQCVVFNCSDGLDYKAMGKFFKGLASSGAWACFDEFNRIEIEVLSVVAQQIMCILMAIRANVKKFMFEGTELTLNPTCYVCITMNPGYAGRTELPDNLKVLFRTVAMMVPDYAMIGEISLYSYGFIDARKLSVKIVTVYRLCSEQLSSQNHYDYGMRAVKSVLSAAGNNKRKAPDENEDILLLRAITDVNLPKFLNHDIPLFEGIISDLFPGIKLPAADYTHFIRAMKSSMSKRNLQPRDSFILKIVQTYEMMIVRHGFMIVGDPLAGKSSVLKVMADALTKLNKKGFKEEKVKYQIINPKAITMGQLYGQFDPISYEWTDGVVATCFRRFVIEDTPDRKWVIFDGPVDAVWIENMNTVLDDNKKLCLMSGEVMAMTNAMSMIFEVMDLTQASPATVSRCGMVYMESATLGWRPFMKSWLVNLNPKWYNDNTKEAIVGIFNWFVDPSLYFIRKFCKQLCVTGEICLVQSMYQTFEMILNGACEDVEDDTKFQTYLMGWIQASFIYAGVWGLGGILDRNSRERYDEFVKNMWRGLDPANPYPPFMEKLDILIPNDGLMIDYIYIYKLKGAWKYWPEVARVMRVEEAANIQQALIPTVDTVKYISIAEMHIKYNKPILLVGPTGTGKSFYLQDLLMNKLNEEIYEPAFITFTVKISANQTQELIISKLFKRKRGQYGPTRGKKCVLFVDDLSMPVKEVYGAQPPIELLRQFFDHKNWYDLKDTAPIYLNDILFIAAMGIVGGSRQEVYPRFLRHFSIFSINEFADESMQKIYCNILHLALKKNGFPIDVMQTVNQFVAATMDVYLAAMEYLRPTPAKSHYVFNLRDFSRVIFGCGMLRKDTVEKDNKKIFPRLWVHECLRVFYDRLIDDDDKTWLYEKLRQSVRDYFKDFFDNVFDHLEKNEEGKVLESSLNDLMFGTYLDTDATEEDIKYEEILNIEHFFEVSMSCLEEYNSTHKTKMDIVLFRYALEHLSKICRILAIPSGCGLLVGISGSGRQSLTKLATTISGHGFFQPEITNTYSMNEWRDDLKRILRESGGKAKHTTFLFTEGQIKEEGFLQDIDGLLNSGEVPNIFPIDERQEVLEMVRLAAQGGQRNLDISALAVFSFFIKRCKEKLHIILCFSPIGTTFRNRLRLYPSLVNCCTIDWFEDWPESALKMVADGWIAEINLDDKVKAAAVIACKHFHVVARNLSESFYKETGRKTYVTSASYLELIKSFTAFTNIQQEELMQMKDRYIIGLGKLANAAEQVYEMQRSLEEYQPQIVQMTNRAIEMTKQIETETREVEIASSLVRQDEKIANVQAAGATALKNECEADLALAIPILEEAIEALNTLKPTDITLVKSMKNPPDTVKLVMAAVCVMKDVKPDRLNDASTGRKVIDFWGPSKRLLGEMNFLQLLKDFDKDNIKPEIMKKIRTEYLPNKFFKPHIVAKASSAAEGLCKWIIAMDLYDAVAREVAPKKAKLAIAEKEYANTMAILKEKKELLEKLEQRLANLNEMLAEATAKQKELQDKVDLCAAKLRRAEKLLGGLGGERNRWTTAAENLQNKYDNLAGDVLLSCGVISYLSAFAATSRNDAVDGWQDYVKKLNIPSSASYDFTIVLGSDIKVQNWYISSLPRDAFSTENAIIQDNSRRWSLLIDPQNQANNWIKKMERSNEILVTKFTDANYMKILEKCVQNGKPALIEGILEDLEAPLDPILFKCTFSQAGIEVIALGDNVVPYSRDFKLYLTTKLRNPHYLPEVFNKVTIINFALTVDGLQDQLLGIVVAKERPDLQRQREDLIIRSAANKAALKDVEENILKTLSESQGDILEDETAIQILDHSKAISVDIIKKQVVAVETERKIEGFRMDYKPIAEHSAVLYYCISDLPNVDPMYQYSLAWFINLYISSIESANKSRDLKKRLQFLKEAFTYNLYTNVCRSLFEKDKLMFSFILCTTILLYQKKLDETEVTFLLTGGINIENTIPNPSQGWLNEKSWDEICRVNDDLPSFNGFRKSFAANLQAWQTLYDTAEPQDSALPNEWNSKLTPFQKLIVIRLIRRDKAKVSVSKFVEQQIGNKFIMPPPFDISKSFEESSCMCPLLFILSPGTDPMAALTKFAELKGYSEKFVTISLGQGQGPIAAALIEKAQDDGGWVCLQNCHLAVSWMNNLESIWEAMDPTNTSNDFRLWLTSYPSNQFPVSILQFGVKMTNEPPTGLQQNLLRSYINEPVKNEEFYTGCPGKEFMFAKLLYGIAFFHAVIQERRTFGPLGWNIPYGFNESDFDISVQQLRMYINENENPYEAVIYLTGECNYGGRVTDDWDRRLIVTILEDFLNPNIVDDMSYTFVEVGNCYGLPRKFDYLDYLEHINNLPQVHPPEVYGLHSNAGITRDLQLTNLLLESIILVRGEGAVGGGAESDKLVLMVAGDLSSKLPKIFDIEKAKAKYPVKYKESMNTVLVQEMERFNKLLSEIITSLSNLDKAVKGLVIMSPALELLANSLILGKIPASWAKVSYPSLKSLPNYIQDFVDRLSFLNNWYENGKPINFWLSGFFFTQAFLTGAKQNYARKYTIPIDQLTFDFDVLKVNEMKRAPEDGIYIFGIYTDGARWNRSTMCLDELYPKILYDSMPLIWLRPILVTSFNENGRYMCPLYKTSERRGILSTTGHSTNYVLPFLLNTKLPPAHWIKRSVALLCQLD